MSLVKVFTKDLFRVKLRPVFVTAHREFNLLKEAVVKYFYLEDFQETPDASRCTMGEVKTITVQGIVDPAYGDSEIRTLGEYQETTCFAVGSEFYPYRFNYCPYGRSGVWLTNQLLFEFPPGHVSWVHSQREVELNSTTVPMTGSGGIDIPTVSLYSGNYQGGWFATLTVSAFNPSLIPADFQANPARYGFGEFSLGYHGFTVRTSKLEHRKTFLPLHVWFPTLEPAGTIQDVNVWVPVPTWERSSSIKWHLNPSVEGECTVWWMKLINGMDAYF